jgi:hypothetical protein
MHNKLTDTTKPVSLVSSFVENLGFISLILILALIVYFDDIQLTQYSYQDVPTIYNVRVFGLKVVDLLSLFLFFILLWYLVLRESFTVTPFHKSMLIIFLVYCYAGVIGFIYSFFYHYDYAIWLQDFQQTIYMVGFFLFTFYFLTTKTKWAVFVISFLLFLTAKNLIIFYSFFSGSGILYGDWAFRASQNSEFTYFPMMFFCLLTLFLVVPSFFWKTTLGLAMIVYLFNSLIGIYRTVWVMLIFGMIYLFFQLRVTDRKKLLFYFAGCFLVTLTLIYQFLPRFLDLAWNYKFASIFDWSLRGDRSNAIRLLEIINLPYTVFSNFSFIQGMGLGAWWDDTGRRLLPDLGSGFTYKTRFNNTHMWYLTQFLKIGLVGLFFYWLSIYRIFRRVKMFIQTMSWNQWEKCILVGMNVGLLCAFISSADFPRLFLFIGINIGITSSFIYLDQQQHVSPA